MSAPTRPVTGGMLLLAAVLTAPAIAGAATGELPLDVALTRYLMVAGLCWALLTLAAEWLWSEPARPVPAGDGTPAGSNEAGQPGAAGDAS